MTFWARMFQHAMRRVEPKVKPQPKQPIKAAGILFTDYRVCLAGYQPNKTIPHISGIGGCAEENESPLTTAVRETAEELLGILPSKSILWQLKETLGEPVFTTTRGGSYTLFVFTFEALERMLCALDATTMSSPLYDSLPTTIYELIWKRKIIFDTEISHLVLLPYVSPKQGTPFIDPNFLGDLEAVTDAIP